MSNEELSNSLAAYRTKRGMTQQALAQAVGVSRQTINSIEKGRFVPSTLVAIKLSHLFGVSVNEVFSLGPLPPEPKEREEPAITREIPKPREQREEMPGYSW